MQPTIVSIAAAGTDKNVSVFGYAEDGKVYIWDRMQGYWSLFKEGV